MTKKEHYAFPVVVNDNIDYFYGGLSKREYFAAMAMQGYISSGRYIITSDATVAIHSVEIADALIKALNESKP